MEPLDRIREVVSEILDESPEIAAAYLYGSQAQGRGAPLSDIDLAFVLTPDASPYDPLLVERLAGRIASALHTAVEIDAHNADDLPLPVRGRVVTSGVLLYERDPVRRVDFETSTRRLYFDLLPLLDRDAREGLLARG